MEKEEISWVDYSNASAVEEFNARVESVFSKWGLGDETARQGGLENTQDPKDDTFGVKTDNVPLGKDVYTLTLISPRQEATDDIPPSLLSQGSEGVRYSQTISNLSFVELSMLQNYFDLSSAWDSNFESAMASNQNHTKFVPLWFGLDHYIVASAVGRTANSNDVSLLLSSCGMACESCNPSLPCFVASERQKIGFDSPLDRLADGVSRSSSQNFRTSLYGIGVSGSANPGCSTTHFNSCVEQAHKVPAKLLHLSGLTHLFRCKLYPSVMKSKRSDLSVDNVGVVLGGGELGVGGGKPEEFPASMTSPESEAPQVQNDLNTLAKHGDGVILISVRHTYTERAVQPFSRVLAQQAQDSMGSHHQSWSQWYDGDFRWRLHLVPQKRSFASQLALAALQGGESEAPLWGPLKDPIVSFSLSCAWPPFKEAVYVENATYSSLTFETAPIWALSATTQVEWDQRSNGSVEEELDDSGSRFGDANNGSAVAAGDREENEPRRGVAGASTTGREADESSEQMELAAVCPLGVGVWYVFLLLQAAEGSYRNLLLSRVARPSTSQRSLGSMQTHKAAQSLFIPIDYMLLGDKGLEKLHDLQANFMQGSLSNVRYRDCKRRIYQEDANQKSASIVNGADAYQKTTESQKKFNILTRPCPECWLCSPRARHIQERGKGARKRYCPKLPTAPVGSLLSLFAVRMSDFGASIEEFSMFWREFCAMLRWHWENLVLVPLNGDLERHAEKRKQASLVYEATVCPVDHQDCILHQKLCLLNLCISARAHAQFKHESFPEHRVLGLDTSSSSDFVMTSRSRDGCGDDEQGNAADADEDEEDADDDFFDAESRSVQSSNSRPGTPVQDILEKSLQQEQQGGTKWVEPWTIEECLMTKDMIRDKSDLMTSLAINSSTANVHEEMLSSALLSDMRAFKAANPSATYEGFRAWKSRSRRLGEYWRSLWNSPECVPAPLQDQIAHQDPSNPLFDPCQEAEKLLHHLETVSPEQALSQLFGVALENAAFVLSDAVECFQAVDSPRPYDVLRNSMADLACQLNRLDIEDPETACKSTADQERSIRRAKQRSAVEAVERMEFQLGMAMSLLHKLPPRLAGEMLEQETSNGTFYATLCKDQLKERAHIRQLLFRQEEEEEEEEENSDVDDDVDVGIHEKTVHTPEPNQKEYVLRALAHRPSFSQPTGGHSDSEHVVRLGANRMYACVGESKVILATALSETSFL